MDDEEPSQVDTSGTSTGTSSGPSFDPPAACERSDDCEDPEAPHCVAPYDPGTATLGPATCVATCVAVGDLARGCLDDDACCEGLRCNPVDGFCIDEASTSSSSGEGDSSSSTGGGSSSSGSSSSSGTDSTSG